MEWLALVAAGIIMSLENDLDLFALHTQQPKLSLQKKRRKRGREKGSGEEGSYIIMVISETNLQFWIAVCGHKTVLRWHLFVIDWKLNCVDS